LELVAAAPPAFAFALSWGALDRVLGGALRFATPASGAGTIDVTLFALVCVATMTAPVVFCTVLVAALWTAPVAVTAVWTAPVAVTAV
jgi:hypothetical protein